MAEDYEEEDCGGEEAIDPARAPSERGGDHMNDEKKKDCCMKYEWASAHLLTS